MLAPTWVHDPPDRLVTQDQRVLCRTVALKQRDIAAAHPGELNAHQDLTVLRLRLRYVLNDQSVRGLEYRGSHALAA